MSKTGNMKKRTGSSVSLREALELFEDNIPEIQTAVMDNMKNEIAQLRRPNATEHNLFWVQKEVFFIKLQEIKNRLIPTLRLIALRTQPQKENMITNLDILKAKEYLIENLLPNEVKRGMTLCPLHNEKTPSFQVKKNNTWVCHGCQEFGDAIDLYQKLYNTSFLEAVRKLQ